ncbi:hypothetical protein FE633_10815 [Streptomyces montanus]|uniref:Uncharacterized protein n=1 Tax=Streptomyces montanus TaxID=2580423 RepID=A0A5R9FXM3_9ACTN|nr:hypothetical protein [Streptomyces montanus]TLS46038.1 hypothetical protein FE633_10815 [Streptomyces montanus]
MEEFGYLKRTREPTDKGTFRREQVVCDDPELLQGEPPAPENPAPENPPESGPPGTGNQAPVNQALKDKDGNHKENPSGSAAPGGSVPTVSQRAMKVAKGFCDKYPLHSFHGVCSMDTRAIQAGYDEPRITRALKALAEAGKPVTLGTLRWELEGPPTFERQPRTVDDPGTSVNDRGVDEVLW